MKCETKRLTGSPTGEPTGLSMSGHLTESERTRLLKLLETRTATTTSGCREWLGGSKFTGESYGAIWFRGRSDRAHRVFVMLNGVEYPRAKTVVRHLCGNSQCVNPAHLAVGTSSENNLDAIEHGTRSVPAPLSEEDQQTIRKHAALGWSSWQIAENWFLPRSTVYDYMRRHSLSAQPEEESDDEV